MEAPDKIYLPVNPFNDGGTEDFCVNHKTFDTDIEYIHKDKLLEWAKKENLKFNHIGNEQDDNFARGVASGLGYLISKLSLL